MRAAASARQVPHRCHWLQRSRSEGFESQRTNRYQARILYRYPGLYYWTHGPSGRMEVGFGRCRRSFSSRKTTRQLSKWSHLSLATPRSDNITGENFRLQTIRSHWQHVWIRRCSAYFFMGCTPPYVRSRIRFTFIGRYVFSVLLREVQGPALHRYRSR